MCNKFLNISQEPSFSKDVTQLFADLEYLGILKKYGSFCLLINSLVAELLRQKGYQTKIIPCEAIVNENHQVFILGAEYAAPGQLAGHIACVVDDRHIVDFGLGNIRRSFDTEFFLGIAAPLNPNASQVSGVQFQPESYIVWQAAPAPHDLADFQALQVQVLAELVEQVQQFSQRRIAFCVHRALGFVYKKRDEKMQLTHSAISTNPKPNFEETLSR